MDCAGTAAVQAERLPGTERDTASAGRKKRAAGTVTMGYAAEYRGCSGEGAERVNFRGCTEQHGRMEAERKRVRFRRVIFHVGHTAFGKGAR